VFVGPSGCGKSTLLRMVAGLEDITSGELSIKEQRVNETPPSRRGVAMVFQSYALYPHMTAYENMAFGLKQARTAKTTIDKRVRNASKILQLDPLLQRRPRELSGGQRQRVAIGRAIVREPDVFLFDEPLSNLDASLRVQTRLEIAKLHRDIGTASTIYVTHDQVEAMTLADKDRAAQRRRIGAAGGQRGAIRRAPGALPSSPQQIRRRFHRQPHDELHRGPPDRRQPGARGRAGRRSPLPRRGRRKPPAAPGQDDLGRAP
jgi:ABC-type sugar transport system ATPase subunit